MKKIETLIEKAKGKRIAFVIPEELLDTVTDYFNNDELTRFVKSHHNEDKVAFDFDNTPGKLMCATYDYYEDIKYVLITLTKEDFEDIDEPPKISTIAETTNDNRTLLITHDNTLAVNDKTNDIYFSDEEAKEFLVKVIPAVYIIIPVFGKSCESRPHIFIY
jgi:hypothetical protein